LQLGARLVLVLLLSAGAASSQVEAQQKAAAEALFDEGLQLLGQGLVESACRRFEQSQEIDSGVGTLLYLADCYERLGKLASAWATWREASSAAAAKGQAERSRIADERARKLGPSLSRLVLLVPVENRVPGFELLLDGRAVSPALFAVPFPLDPGQHELTARSPGHTPWSSILDIKADANSHAVEVPVLGRPAAPTDAPTPAAAAAPAAPMPPPEPSALDMGSPRFSGRETNAFLVGGAGILALGTGVVLGVLASNKDEEAKPDCPDRCRTREGADLNESARTFALVANISYGLGLAALATGVVLYLTPGSTENTSAAVPFELTPLIGKVDGLAVSGAF
jgi:hypothetical protein